MVAYFATKEEDTKYEDVIEREEGNYKVRRVAKTKNNNNAKSRRRRENDARKKKSSKKDEKNGLIFKLCPKNISQKVDLREECAGSTSEGESAPSSFPTETSSFVSRKFQVPPVNWRLALCSELFLREKILEKYDGPDISSEKPVCDLVIITNRVPLCAQSHHSSIEVLG